jgi:hypothetical protein
VLLESCSVTSGGTVLELERIVITAGTTEERMSNSEEERPSGASGKPWFRRNRTGPGWHPSSWQGLLIVLLIVAAIVTVVVLLRTGVL